jgi:hypothetical protein
MGTVHWQGACAGRGKNKRFQVAVLHWRMGMAQGAGAPGAYVNCFKAWQAVASMAGSQWKYEGMKGKTERGFSGFDLQCSAKPPRPQL